MTDNPFDGFSFGPAPTDKPQMAEPGSESPFDKIGSFEPKHDTSFMGALGIGALSGAAPAVGGLAGAGYGAAVGSALGPFGSFVGGAIGAFAGGYGAGKAQDFAISELPHSWQDPINEYQRSAEEQHPTASFLGGMVPMALTMSPNLSTAAGKLAPDATRYERIAAHPVAGRLFGGAVQGAFQLGQDEYSEGQPNWTHVGWSTAFGMVFNRANHLIGEPIERAGAEEAYRQGIKRPAPPEVAPTPTDNLEAGVAAANATAPSPPAAREPTVLDAQDLKVAGVGINEEVFKGSRKQDETAEMSARDAKRTETLLTEPEPKVEPDVTGLVARMEPELLKEHDALIHQRDSLANLAAEQGPESPAAKHLAEVNKAIDETTPQVKAAYEAAAERAGGEVHDPASGEVVMTSGYEGPHDDAIQNRIDYLRSRIESPDLSNSDKMQLADRISDFEAFIRSRDAVLEAENIPPDLQAKIRGLHPDDIVQTRDGKRLKINGWGKDGYIGATDADGLYRNISPADIVQTFSGYRKSTKAGEVGATPSAGARPPDDAARTSVAETDGTPSPSPPVDNFTSDEQRQWVVDDLTRRLIAAGRPADEARGSAIATAEGYEQWARRTGGKFGTARDMYLREHPDIVGHDGRVIPHGQDTAALIEAANVVPNWPDYKVAYVDPAKVDALWSRDKLYVGKGGTGGMADRYKGAKSLIDGLKPGQDFKAPAVSIGAGRVSFDDGRHRFAVMRDEGLREVPVSMNEASLENARRLGLVTREAAPATRKPRKPKVLVTPDGQEAHEIGANADGGAIFETENGTRTVLEPSGRRVSETPVATPTGRVAIAEERTPEFEPVEPQAKVELEAPPAPEPEEVKPVSSVETFAPTPAPAADEGSHFAAGMAAARAGQPRQLPDYFTDKTGKNARDWLRGWDRTPPAEVKPAAAPAEEIPEQNTLPPVEHDGQTPHDKFLAAVKRQLWLGEQPFKTILEARKLAKEHGLEFSEDESANKAVDELVERAVVETAREIVEAHIAEGRPDAETFARMVKLYEDQPNLSTRTSTSIAEQAYSTPAPLAYVASRLAGIDHDTHVLEPTAGNGMLLMEADPKKARVNELNPARFASLKAQGFNPSNADGSSASTFADRAGQMDAVIANPPFGAVREGGKSKVFEVDGFETTQIDHAIALNALKTMKADGRAVLIIGGIKAESEAERAKGYMGAAKRRFFHQLLSKYNVTDAFTVDGDLYAKQGAGWPVDVLVIDGKGKSERVPLTKEPPPLLKSWDQIGERLNAAKQREPTSEVVAGPDSGASPAPVAGGPGPEGADGVGEQAPGRGE